MEPFWLGNADTMHLSKPPILHSHCLEVASTGCHLAPPPGLSRCFDSMQLDRIVQTWQLFVKVILLEQRLKPFKGIFP